MGPADYLIIIIIDKSGSLPELLEVKEPLLESTSYEVRSKSAVSNERTVNVKQETLKGKSPQFQDRRLESLKGDDESSGSDNHLESQDESPHHSDMDESETATGVAVVLPQETKQQRSTPPRIQTNTRQSKPLYRQVRGGGF